MEREKKYANTGWTSFSNEYDRKISEGELVIYMLLLLRLILLIMNNLVNLITLWL